MDRRSTGIAVVALALLTVVALPVSRGQRVAGTAGTADVPILGQCLVDIEQIWQQRISSDGPTPSYRAPTAVPGSCGVAGAGRVLAVDYGRSLPAVLTHVDYQDSLQQLCQQPVTEIVRRATIRQPLSRTGGHVAFEHVPLFGGHLATSTGADPSAGWTACYATGELDLPMAADLNRPLRSPAAGLCHAEQISGSGWRKDVGYLPCSEQHATEVLGAVYATAPSATDDDYQNACVEFARLATGMADPTGGGHLRTAAIDEGSYQGRPNSCQITTTDPDRTLSGSVINLGSSPIPWTG